MLTSDDPRAAVTEFILECSRVSSRIDSVSTHDPRAAIALTLAQAQNDYDRLLRTRDLLFLTRPEASLIEGMLDRLMARLRFLESKI
jgi:hypothetical protein